MTLRTDLSLATRLSNQIDDIAQALVVLALPNVVITVEITAPSAAGVRVPVPLNPTNLTTMLNTRRTNLEAQLTALGVTG